MCKYEIISEPKVLEDASYIAYGISASDGTIVSDISSDKSFVTNILNNIRRAKLEPCHLRDVVEDYLC